MKRLNPVIKKIEEILKPDLRKMTVGALTLGTLTIPVTALANQPSIDVAALQAWQETLPKVMQQASKEEIHPDVKTVVYGSLEKGLPDYTIFNGEGFTHLGTIDELLTLGKTVGIGKELKDVLSNLGYDNCNEKLIVTKYDNFVVVQPANGLVSGSNVIVDQGSMGYVSLNQDEISKASGWTNVFNDAGLTRHKLLEESFPGLSYEIVNPDGEHVKLSYGIQNDGLIIVQKYRDGTSMVSFTDKDGNTIVSAKGSFGDKVGFFDSSYNNSRGLTLDATIEQGPFGITVESAESLAKRVSNVGDACNPKYVTGWTSVPWNMRKQLYEKTVNEAIKAVLGISKKAETDECVSCYNSN